MIWTKYAETSSPGLRKSYAGPISILKTLLPQASATSEKLQLLSALPEILDSNGEFGETDFEGILGRKIPIRSVMGDSHAALYGQRCHESGMMKTTYGTGSSMMLNTGNRKTVNRHGLVSSLAQRIDGVPNLPAFTGLSAPCWSDHAKAAVLGMSRTTKKAEFAKAAVESIAHQVADVFEAMALDFVDGIKTLRADGGPTGNPYLMLFQSDMAGCSILVPNAEELSAIGTAYLAGIFAGIYDKTKVIENISYHECQPDMPLSLRAKKRRNWKEAVQTALGKN